MIRYLLLFVFGLFISPARAQSDSSRVLDNVVIHGNRIQPAFDETAASVIVISVTDIQHAPAQSVADLLHYYTGIDIRQRGANGVQADAGIRGSTFDQVLILINGIKVSDAQTGHHSLNLPVDLDNVERIEILKGSAARIFGQNAFAGAINVITKNPDESFIKVQAQAGAHGLGGLRLAASMGGEKVRQYFSASRDFSEGYQYNTDYSISNLFYQTEIKTSQGKISVLGGLTDRSFGANGFYASPDFKDQYEAVQTSLVGVSLQNNPRERMTINHRLYWRRNQDEYLFVRNDPNYFRNFHINNTVGYETNVTLMNNMGITGLGLDVNKLWLVSTNLGDRERTVATFFAEHRFENKNHTMSATPGVQLNYYSDFGVNLFPGLDVGFAVSDKLMLYANTGYTYRVPTYTDLYYSDPANSGNPDLLPEYAISYEGGVRLLHTKPFQLQTAYFVRNGKRIIDWTKEVSTDPWRPDNLINVNMKGVEFNMTWRPAGLLLISKVEVGYTYIDAAKATDPGFSRYALENLTNQVVANVALKYSGRLIHAVNFRFSDRVNLPTYRVVDTRLTWQSKSIGLFADVTNIFDVTYRETNLVTMPGRWFKLGVSYRN